LTNPRAIGLIHGAEYRIVPGGTSLFGDHFEHAANGFLCNVRVETPNRILFASSTVIELITYFDNRADTKARLLPGICSSCTLHYLLDENDRSRIPQP